MQLMSRINHTESGFTLVELLIATILSSVVVIVFIGTLLNMISTADRFRVQLELNGETQMALDTVERDVRLSTGFAATLPSTAPFTDSYGPTNTDQGWGGTWSYRGTDPDNATSPNKTLILRLNSTVTNALASNRTLTYIEGFTTNPYATIEPTYNCTTALTVNYKLPYYSIYFVRDNTLYRRTVTDTSTALCNGPQRQKQSCPREDVTPASNCQAYDEILAENVSGFRVTYYQQEDTPTPTFTDLDVYNGTAVTDFDTVDNILITISMSEKAAGKPITSELSIRVSRIN